MEKLSKSMNKFFDDLREAEFGTDAYGYTVQNPKEMVKLLKRALNWKTLKNLERVCCYLGSECDARTETVEGCKEIIREDIEYWKSQI